MNIQVSLRTEPKTQPDFTKGPVPFGKNLTDHMFFMDYDTDKGWHSPRIVPEGPVLFDLSTSAMHYGQSIFEGLKAYNTKDGSINLFRPYENAQRFNKSAARLSMPEFPVEYMVDAIKALVDIDKSWIPDMPGTSLYIRPFMFASEPTLNITPSTNYTFCILLSPVASISGGKPFDIVVEEHYIRAAPGGTGFAKCAGNYAAAVRASAEANKNGFHQVLWLDAVHRKYIEEVSAMNVFFVIDGKLITPLAGDTILDGVTRKSIVQIVKDWGHPVEERNIAIDELLDAHASGKISEVFCAGTAAVITPIASITYGDTRMEFNGGQVGQLSTKIYEELVGIQTGALVDTRGWIEKI